MPVRNSLFIILFCLLFSLSACDGSPDAQVSYKPPFAPVTLSINNQGNISIEGDTSITTPIGDFSVSAGGYTASQQATPTPEKLTLIIRHSKNGQVVDSVYSLATSDQEVSITTDGLTQITITSHQVFIDATKSIIKRITLKDVRPLVYSLGEDIGGSLAWSPDGKLVAVSDTVGEKIQIFRASDASPVLTLDSTSSLVFLPTIIAWSPDGKYIASSSDEHQISIFNATTGDEVQQYDDHLGSQGVSFLLAWSPDSKYLVLSGENNSKPVYVTNVFDAFTGRQLVSHEGASESSPCTWTSDGKNIMTTSIDGTTQIWNAFTGQNLYTFSGMYAACLSPNGKQIASLSQDDSIHIVDAFSGKNEHLYRGKGAFFVWSSDNTRIMSWNLTDKNKPAEVPFVEIWNAQTGNTIVTYRYPYKTFTYNGQTYADTITDAQWSPNGNQIAILFDNEVTIQNSSPS